MLSKLIAQRLFALFCCGWLFFNFPLLGLWDVDAAMMGVPLLVMALFGLWTLLIGALAWLMERSIKTGEMD